MSATNGNAAVEIDVDPAVFQNMADLEKEFAKVELDALRRKEFALRNLYTKRNVLSSKIPSFWPSVLMSGPQEFQSILTELDMEPVSAIKALNIERYQIKSETEGEPRSLRFTFEFDENDWFEDKRVVKDFEFVENDEDSTGSLISKPVTFRWKKKGKKANNGLLDLAVDLYKAEEAVRLTDGKSGKELEVVDRENLWQYEKLREKLEKAEEDNETEASWLDWFGYRGPISKRSEKKHDDTTNGNHEHDEDEDMEEDEDDGMLDVEICPGGEEVAIALAEDLWPNVMDYFMASQQEPLTGELDEFDGLDSDEDVADDHDDDDAPELVEVEEARPSKRQRKA